MCAWFFEMKGITLSFFFCAVGVPGICRTSQKSSASRPERYPCRVSGVDSTTLDFPFTLSADWVSGFCLHMKVCGVPGCCVVWDCAPEWTLPDPGEFNWGKLMSLGCSSGMGLLYVACVSESVGFGEGRLAVGLGASVVAGISGFVPGCGEFKCDFGSGASLCGSACGVRGWGSGFVWGGLCLECSRRCTLKSRRGQWRTRCSRERHLPHWCGRPLYSDWCSMTPSPSSRGSTTVLDKWSISRTRILTRGPNSLAR